LNKCISNKCKLIQLTRKCEYEGRPLHRRKSRDSLMRGSQPGCFGECSDLRTRWQKRTAQLRDFLIFTFRQTSEWVKSVVSLAAECHTVSGPPGYGHRVVLPASSAPKIETAVLSETSVPICRTTQHYIPRDRATDKNFRS